MKLVWKIVAIAAVVLLVIGAALIVVSLVTGGSLESIRNNVAFTDYEQSFPDTAPHTLELYVSAGTLHILPGEELRVEAKNVQQQNFVCALEQGLLTVREDWGASWSDNLARWLKLQQNEPEIWVYLPEDYIPLLVNIRVDAGVLDIQGLTAEETVVELAAGSVTADGLDTRRLALELKAGEAGISGTVAERCAVSASAGSANLRLTGVPEDYTAHIRAGVGRIEYGGAAYSMEEAAVGQGAGTMELDCSVGRISVAFDG